MADDTSRTAWVHSTLARITDVPVRDPENIITAWLKNQGNRVLYVYTEAGKGVPSLLPKEGLEGVYLLKGLNDDDQQQVTFGDICGTATWLRLGIDCVTNCIGAGLRSTEKALEDLGIAEASLHTSGDCPITLQLPVEDDMANYEATALAWIKTMKGFVAETEVPNLPIPQEREQYLDDANLIASVLSQYQTDSVQDVVAALVSGRSPLAAELLSLPNEMKSKAEELVSWAAHMTPIVECYHQLSDPAALPPLDECDIVFKSVLSTARHFTEQCPSYATPTRTVIVLSRMSTALAGSVTAKLRSNASQPPGKKLLAVLYEAAETLCLFKHIYLMARPHVATWKLTLSASPFSHLDKLVERIRDIIDMMSSRLLFTGSLPEFIPSASCSERVTTRLKTLKFELSATQMDIAGLLTSFETEFDKSFARFKSIVRDIEQGLASLLKDILSDQRTSLQGSVKIVMFFYPFRDRVYFRPAWVRACTFVSKLWQKELQETRKALQGCTKIPENGLTMLPRCAAVLLLGAGLLERNSLPNVELVLSQEDHVFQVAKQLEEDIKQFMTKEVEEWSSRAEAAINQLQTCLLKVNRFTGAYQVAFDPNIVQVILDAISLKRTRHNVVLPTAVEELLQSWDTVRRRRGKLEALTQKYFKVQEQTDTRCSALLKTEKRAADACLQAGLENRFSWGSGNEVDTYILECEKAVAKYLKALRLLEKPVERAAKLLSTFNGSDPLFPFCSRLGAQTVRLGEEWTTMYTSHTKERHAFLRSIPMNSTVSISEMNALRDDAPLDAMSDVWLLYTTYVSDCISDMVDDAIWQALRRFGNQLDGEWLKENGGIPFISFSLRLSKSGSIVYTPCCDTLRSAISRIIADILAYSDVVLRCDGLMKSPKSNSAVSSCIAEIWSIVDEALLEATECELLFEPIVNRWGTPSCVEYPDVDPTVIMTFGDIFKDLEKVVTECEAAGVTLRRLPNTFHLKGWLVLETKPLRAMLATNAGLEYRAAVEYIHKVLEVSVADIEKLIEETHVKLAPDSYRSDVTTDAGSLLVVLETMREVRERDEVLSDLLAMLEPSLKLLRKQQALPNHIIDNLEERVANVPVAWKVLMRRVAVVKSDVAAAQDGEVASWIEDWEAFNDTVAEFVTLVESSLPTSIIHLRAGAKRDPYAILTELQEDVFNLLKEEKEILKLGSMLELTQNPSPQLASYAESLRTTKALWDTAFHIVSVLDEWHACPFNVFIPSGLQLALTGLEEDLLMLGSAKSNWLFVDVSELLAGWKRVLPVIQGLSKNHLHACHWTTLIPRWQPDTTLTVGHVIDAGIPEQELKEVLNIAAKQRVIELKLEAIANRWKTIKMPARWGGIVKTWLLNEQRAQEYLAFAESDQIELQKLQYQPHTTKHIECITTWLGNTHSLQKLLVDWVAIQNKWMTVMMVLRSDSYLPAYKQLHMMYSEVMAALHNNTEGGKPSVLLDCVASVTELSEGRFMSSLALVEEKMAVKIAMHCTVFPRFEMLPRSTLLEILVATNDPVKSLELLWTVAPGCGKVVFSPVAQIPVSLWSKVTAVTSLDGVDELRFAVPYVCKGSSAEYYNGLLLKVQKTVCEMTEESWKAVHEIPHTEWGATMTTQMLFTAARLSFTAEVESAFDQLEDGNKESLNELLKITETQVTLLASRLRGSGGLHSLAAAFSKTQNDEPVLTSKDKKRVSSLIVLDIHHRNVLNDILFQKATSSSDLVWSSQLRLRWDEAGRRPIAHCAFNCTIPMGNEFVTNSSGMLPVPTLETSRARIMMLMAFQMQQCAVVAGNTACGKSTVVHELASSLGQHLVVVMSTPNISLRHLVRVFKAAMKTDSWVLLSRCHKLSASAILVAGQKITETLKIKREGRILCEVAATITPTTHAAPLPEALRKNSRLISLMPMSIEAVAVTMLQSFGMRNALTLGRKLSTFFKYGSALLPGYQWGLPTLRALLVSIDARRHTTSETDAVVNAVHAVQISAMMTDAPIALQLLDSLFPQKVVEGCGSIDMMTAILQERGYSSGEGGAFANACVGLSASLGLRRANCIIGPPGCGKTVCWEVVTASLQLETGVVYPKAMTHQELTKAMHGHVNAGAGIIVLDTLPGTWLDDFAPLVQETALPSFGLLQETKVLIETTDLINVTPGVVVRLGITVLRQSDVEWLSITGNWIKTLPLEHQNVVDYLCDAHLPAILMWLRKHCKNASELNVLGTVQVTIEALLNKIKHNDSPKAVEQAFAYACLWSLGAILSEQDAMNLMAWWKKDFPLSSLTDSTWFPLEAVPKHCPVPGMEDAMLTQQQCSAICYANLLQSRNRSVVFTGPQGSGKTVVLRHLAACRSGTVLLGNPLMNPAKWTSAHSFTSPLIIFIDDMHTLAPIAKETLRKSLNNDFGMSFSCTSQKVQSCPRLARKMTTIALHGGKPLWLLLAKRISWHFNEETYSPEVAITAEMLEGVSLKLAELLVPEEYFTNMSQSNALSMLGDRMTSTKHVISNGMTLLEFWRHEAIHVLTDSLMCTADITRMKSIIDGALISVFDILPENKCEWGPFIGNTWSPGAPKYRIESVSAVTAIIQKKDEKNGPLLVDDVVVSIMRIANILDAPHAVTLLTGSKHGMGKHTMATIAARLCNLRIMRFSPDVSPDRYSGACVIMKETNVCSWEFIHNLLAVPDVRIVITSTVSTSKIPSVAKSFPSLFGSAWQCHLQPVGAATKSEMAFNILIAKQHILGTAKEVRQLAEFASTVHQDMKDIREAFSTTQSFLDILLLIIKFAEDTKTKNSQRKRAVHEGIAKLQATAGQAVVLEARLQEENSAVKAQTRHTEKLVENLEKITRQHHECNVLQNMQQRAVDRVSSECNNLSREVAQDLAALKPTVDSAYMALKALDKSLINDLKTMIKPSIEVVNVCSAVLVLTSEGRIPKDKSWNTCKKMMSSPVPWVQSLMNMDCNNIPQAQAEYVQKLVRDNKSHFAPNHVSTKNLAAGHLCTWLLNMLSYHETRGMIRPKEEKMKELKMASDSSRAVVLKTMEKSKQLIEALDESSNEVRASTELCEKMNKGVGITESKLSRASALMQSLGSDGEWATSATKQSEGGIGDVALAAALISHGGALNDTERRNLLRLRWPTQLEGRNLTYSSKFPLVSAAEIALWENNGLPAHVCAHESASVVASSIRVPLLVDPHNQGTKWLIKQYAPVVISNWCEPSQLTKCIVSCIKDDKQLLIKHLSPTLHPVLVEVLENIISRTVVIDGTRYVLGKNFKLYCSTQLLGDSLPDKVVSLFSIANFEVAKEGLEEMLLGAVVDIASPELEKKRVALVREANQRTIDMQEADGILLLTLSTAEGELLDNPELVSALKTMKLNTSRMESALKQSQEAQKDLAATRDRYRPATKRGALLFLQVQMLEKLNPMYAFSLTSFIKVFKSALSDAVKRQEEECDAFEAYSKGMADDMIAMLANELSAVAVEEVFQHLAAALRQHDCLTLATSLCLAVLREEQPRVVQPDLCDVLFNGPGCCKKTVHNPLPWLPEDKWTTCLVLEDRLQSFKGLTMDLATHARWYQWYHHMTPEEDSIPGEWQALDQFSKLLIVKCLRPDRLPRAMELFIEANIGKAYVTPAPPDVPKIVQDGGAQSLLVWTSGGHDIYNAVYSAHSKISTGNLLNIDLHEDEAMDILEKSAKRGGWCVTEGVHLFKHHRSRLASILSSTLHTRFMLVMSADGNRAGDIPVSIRRHSRKVTTDTSCTIKTILQHSWQHTSAIPTTVQRHSEFKLLLFLATYLHSICLQRNTYGSNGFVNSPYSFGNGDLKAVQGLIEMWLSTGDELKWSDIQHSIVDLVYGAHVSCTEDAKILTLLGRDILKKDNMQRTDFNGVLITGSSSTQDVAHCIDSVEWGFADDIGLAGLSLAAGMLQQQDKAVSLCSALVRLSTTEGCGGNGVLPLEQSVLLSQVPPDIDLSTIPDKVRSTDMSPLTFQAWHYEAKMVTQLTSILRSDLTASSVDMLDTMTVPERWSWMGFPSNLPLGSWFALYLKREAYIREWAENPMNPAVVMLHLLLRPKSFLTYITLEAVKGDTSNMLTLENAVFTAEVAKKPTERFDTPARSGLHVWGIRLLLCRWNATSLAIEQPLLTDPQPLFPVVTLRVATSHSSKVWVCPLYRTSNRLHPVITLPLPAKANPDTLSLASAAAVLEPLP